VLRRSQFYVDIVVVVLAALGFLTNWLAPIARAISKVVLGA
jgi:hypothetical protein